MRPYEFHSFEQAIQQAGFYLQHRSRVVHSDHWQGSDIRNKPEMATHEVKHCSFQVDMGQYGVDLSAYAQAIQPNLPWADNHFAERTCGYPINPGVEWAKWPYGNSAQKFLDERGMFNHNYMERYWPKHAGLVSPTPTRTVEEFRSEMAYAPQDAWAVHRGIMYEYGDLNDVVDLLVKDPFTRQAYLPVWFPEDTGGGSKRAPCSLGYHFMFREGRLDVDYHIRSCDFVRHFRDDIYLTVRLLIWVIAQASIRDEQWLKVTPGKFVMHIGSLHMFVNDYRQQFGR